MTRTPGTRFTCGAACRPPDRMVRWRPRFEPGGARMPFVNVRLYEGHGKERKDELAKRITQAVTDVCKVPPQAVWVVFEEVPPTDWFAAGAPGQPVKK